MKIDCNAIWYAVLTDSEDNDWGTGSRNVEDAKNKAREYRASGYTAAYIAVIDESGPAAVCVDEIHDLD